MRPSNPFTLIAPCGMNCGICMAYLRDKDHCPGCRNITATKYVSILRCKIRNCPPIKSEKHPYCLDCPDLPCARLKQLDKRYRARYQMSMLENLAFIQEHGIRRFVKKEKTKWQCPVCGGVINVHRWRCTSCGNSRKREAP